MQRKVTIGIPVYGVEGYIRRTMESALEQTYSNIEYLIVDDASDDQSLDILYSIQQTHTRGKNIRILSHEDNRGVSETRNQIIDEATGDYLYFVDSDDVIDKNTISLLMKEIEIHQADVAFGSYERIDLSGQRTIFQYPKMLFEDADSFADFAYQRYAGFQASACNFLVRLSLIRQNHLRFYKADFWEDMAFTLNLVTMVNRAVLLPDITYTYLCRENSLSNSWHHEKIDKSKIVQYFNAVAQLKTNEQNLKVKSYYPNRCYIAMMSDIYIICNILAKNAYIEPAFTKKELVSFMKHPSNLIEILTFKQRRIQNTILYILGKLPACMTLFFIRLFSKYKGL
jgi:glycosyltransferase involved in cell wall biosynthesis